MSMYNILYGSVGVYFDYGTPEQVEVVTLREGDFFNVISFLESRPRNTTAVALENTIVSEITYDNFSAYFREKPAKIMSLLQHMSARMRQMQKAYVDTCHALEVYGDKARLTAEHGEWTDSHNRTYNLLKRHVPVHVPRRREIDTHPPAFGRGYFYRYPICRYGLWKLENPVY